MNNKTIALGTYRHIGTVTLFYLHLPLSGGKEQVYRILVGRPEGRGSLGSP
jgi:hypothetical protein